MCNFLLLARNMSMLARPSFPSSFASSREPTGSASSSSYPSSQSRFDTSYLQKSKGKKQKFELSEQDKREIKESFELFDTKRKGSLDYYELKVAIRSLGIEIKKAEVLQLLEEYSDDGSIDYDSFVEIMTSKFSERNPEDEMRKAFAIFDEDHSGKITLKQLRRIAKELGEDLSETELQAMIDEFDKDQDGAINENEFIEIMKQTSLF
ncbi:centrin [Monocercomonoides exilis]|uniref:centrin n=1 Tax=Monocercomonoides exilis TaxID=2049356 RepID=UPI00355AA247|nr:centrin [Monocercomonoides exilis]|eukprot:MONOS_4497.1-p1 / transcript=MONOS_4497.1 / gene=MONOS_4497 / organism=Monocercomonoides_exilis_PA203 / gene_product=centrin / transcript_product=centrin / location=Mono_scaffold00120:62936-63751(+) / protein_length=208 / sequence_SO=supercontig / SO=protein_coding / is_pseudo=false